MNQSESDDDDDDAVGVDGEEEDVAVLRQRWKHRRAAYRQRLSLQKLQIATLNGQVEHLKQRLLAIEGDVPLYFLKPLLPENLQTAEEGFSWKKVKITKEGRLSTGKDARKVGFPHRMHRGNLHLESRIKVHLSARLVRKQHGVETYISETDLSPKLIFFSLHLLYADTGEEVLPIDYPNMTLLDGLATRQAMSSGQVCYTFLQRLSSCEVRKRKRAFTANGTESCTDHFVFEVRCCDPSLNIRTLRFPAHTCAKRTHKGGVSSDAAAEDDDDDDDDGEHLS